MVWPVLDVENVGYMHILTKIYSKCVKLRELELISKEMIYTGNSHNLSL